MRKLLLGLMMLASIDEGTCSISLSPKERSFSETAMARAVRSEMADRKFNFSRMVTLDFVNKLEERYYLLFMKNNSVPCTIVFGSGRGAVCGERNYAANEYGQESGKLLLGNKSRAAKPDILMDIEMDLPKLEEGEYDFFIFEHVDLQVVYTSTAINGGLRCLKSGGELILDVLPIFPMLDDKSRECVIKVAMKKGGIWLTENDIFWNGRIYAFEGSMYVEALKTFKSGDEFFMECPELLLRILKKIGVNLSLVNENETKLITKPSLDIWPKRFERPKCLLVITKR